MDIKELQRHLEKIDFQKLQNSNVKLSEEDTYVGELYNSAVDNIMQENIDIARMRLTKVVKLDPTFEQAQILLEQIKSLETDKSLGDKMQEALYQTEEPKSTRRGLKSRLYFTKQSGQASESLDDKEHTDTQKKFKPAVRTKVSFSAPKSKMTPVSFIKMLLIISSILLLMVLVLIFTIISMRKSFDKYVLSQPDLQQNIDQLESKILQQEKDYTTLYNEYKENLTTQDERFRLKNEDLDLVRQQNELYLNQKNLYYALSLANDEKYQQAYNLLLSIEDYTSGYTAEETQLYLETREFSRKNITLSYYNSGNKLYQDLKYKEAFDNFQTVWSYYPDYKSISSWSDDAANINMVYDAVYKLGRCAYEIDEHETAIDAYIFVQDSLSEFSNANTEGLIYHLAKAYAAVKEYDKAEQLFTQLIDEFPKSDLISYAKERLAQVKIDREK